MKRTAVLGMILLVTVVASVASYSSADETPEPAPQTLPASLDDLFPPKAESYVFLNAMRTMSAHLSGMMCDLFENDMGNAQVNYQKFKAQYAEISKLVPEWKENLPDGPVDDLGAALRSGDPDRVMAASNIVDAVCQSCHVVNMPKAHFKYHWSDFHSIKMSDPVTGQSMPFKQFKLMMEMNMAGLMNDLAQDQLDNARTQASGFVARFESLNDACVNCHDTERKYFVSDDMQQLAKAVASALNEENVDMGKIGGLLQTIGDESCFKCHLVHVPGAYSKY